MRSVYKVYTFETSNKIIMKITYNVISFCSIVGNFAYAYPSDEGAGLTVKQLKNSPYTVNFYNNLSDAADAMEKLKTTIEQA